MFHVAIFDAIGTPIVVEVSHEVFQVFVEYEREMECRRKADFRHRDCHSWDTCLLFEVSTEPLEQTYERTRILKEIQDTLEEFSPKQRRRFLLHFAYGYTYKYIPKNFAAQQSFINIKTERLMLSILNWRILKM